MKEKKEKLIFDGNALYEIDLDCVQRKEKEREEAKRQQQKKRQRN